jgi:small membrane protein
MTPIQLLLIFFSLIIALFYFQRLRSRLLDRLAFFVLVAIAVIMVARPDWSNAVAHWLGVGRGADLVLYLGISGLAFLWLGLYSRQREMEVRLTELARRLSILQAESPKKKTRKK